MDRLTPELEHLAQLSQSGPAWWEFAMDKAQRLANQEPVEFNSLPVLLKNKVLESRHGPPRGLRPSIPEPRCTDR